MYANIGLLGKARTVMTIAFTLPHNANLPLLTCYTTNAISESIL